MESKCHICGMEATWKCPKCKNWVCFEHTKGYFNERLCEKCWEEEK